MVSVVQLPLEQRLTVVSLSGIARRYGAEPLRHCPPEDALAALWEVARDPFLLGIAAGDAAADRDQVDGRVVGLLVAPGADMKTAAAQKTELRARYARKGVIDPDSREAHRG
jgi:hypothetical protein